MTRDKRSLPQATAESAMALMCTVPASGRGERRVAVHDVVARAVSSEQLGDGVAFRFENTDDAARMVLDLVLAERNCCSQFSYSLVFGRQLAPIELRIQAAPSLVAPLKDLYAALSSTEDSRG